MQEEVKDIIVIFVHLSIKWCVDCAGKYNGPMLCRVRGGGGASLKTCKSCMLVKYCDANCQKSHWPKHKAECKIRAAKLRNEAPFKDSPSKEECPIPICFLLPIELISCVSLPLATISFISIDFWLCWSLKQMRGWQRRLLNCIIHVAERAFAKGLFIHSVSLEAMESVHFEI